MSPPLPKIDSPAPDSAGRRHIDRKHARSGPEVPGAATPIGAERRLPRALKFFPPGGTPGSARPPAPATPGERTPWPKRRPASGPAPDKPNLLTLTAGSTPAPCRPRPPAWLRPLGPTHTHAPCPGSALRPAPPLQAPPLFQGFRPLPAKARPAGRSARRSPLSPAHGSGPLGSPFPIC